MRDEWRKLGHSSPVCRNDRAWKAFELFAPGLDTEADMASDLLKAMFGVVGATEIQPGTDSVPSLSQVCPKSIALALARRILHEADGTADIATLMMRAEHTNRTRFRKTILLPLIEASLLEPTIPDKPTSSKQRYRLTTKGRLILEKEALSNEE